MREQSAALVLPCDEVRRQWRRHECHGLAGRRVADLLLEALPGLFAVRRVRANAKDIHLLQPTRRRLENFFTLGDRHHMRPDPVRADPLPANNYRGECARAEYENHRSRASDAILDLKPPILTAVNIDDVLPHRYAFHTV